MDEQTLNLAWDMACEKNKDRIIELLEQSNKTLSSYTDIKDQGLIDILKETVNEAITLNDSTTMLAILSEISTRIAILDQREKNIDPQLYKEYEDSSNALIAMTPIDKRQIADFESRFLLASCPSNELLRTVIDKINEVLIKCITETSEKKMV